MAKQAGHIRLKGTIGNLTYYQMGGKDYVRMKSSLTRKDFKTKKCFEGSRRSSTRFGAGNIIASEVYQSLPAIQKVYRLFPLLRSKAIALVKQGLARADVKIALLQLVNPPEREQLECNATEDPVNNNLPSVLSEKSIEIVATPVLTSPQPPEKSGQALSKGEVPEPALVKVFKGINNFYPDNSDLLSKDICPQPVSSTTKARRTHGLAAEKATSHLYNLPVTEQRKQFFDFVLRSHRARPDPEHNYVVLSKRAFLTYQRLFLQGP